MSMVEFPGGLSPKGMPADPGVNALFRYNNTSKLFEWVNESSYLGGGGGSPSWGNITGTLSDQTDLQTALDGKAASSHTHTASEITDFNTAADARITAQKGAANGLAPLNSSSKINSVYLPAIAITSRFLVASEAAQLAADAQEGDVAIRSDESKSYIHNGGSAGTMADWDELLSPTDAVQSVNGQSGTVVLDTDDINEGSSNLYYTEARVSANTNVAANTTHRGLTSGNPHSVSASDVGNGTAQWNADKLRGVNIHTATPTNDQVLTYNSTESRWEPQTPSGGGGGGFTPTCFQASKSGGGFTTSSTMADLTGWDVDVDQGSDYTMNTTSGVLTFDTDGTYLISCWVLGDLTGSNRSELQIQMLRDIGAGFAGTDAQDKQYAMRNSSQDEGSAQINNYLLPVDSGDDIKFQVATIGVTADIAADEARISVVKVSDTGRT